MYTELKCRIHMPGQIIVHRCINWTLGCVHLIVGPGILLPRSSISRPENRVTTNINVPKFV